MIATVKRREFITLLGGAAAAWPFGASAQQAPRAARLGYLAPASNPDLQQALLGELRHLGYVEGQNLAIEYRFMLGQSKTYDELAAELAGLACDAIVVVGTPPALALKRQTTTIPIIMAPAADPLRTGLVASLSRPGGNVTGVSLYGSEIARKRMEVFKEAVIGIERIAVLGNAENPLHRLLWDDLQPIGPALGLQFRLFVVSDLGKLPAVFSAIKAEGFDAITLLTDAQFFSARRQISSLAAMHRLPAMYESRESVDDGGLIFYGASIPDLTRRAVAFVVKVIKACRSSDRATDQIRASHQPQDGEGARPRYTYDAARPRRRGDRMKRRTFITLLGGAAAAWPLAARAQQSKVARIGALFIGLADAQSFKKEFQDGMRELGYVEGQNIAYEFRSAEGRLDRLPELAAELVRLKVDVIVALYVPCALAAKQATREIPIVIIAADPVETGIVASLARPGGNITGVSLMSAVFVGKCVELFRDMLAAPRKVAAITNAADPLFAKLALDQVELAGRLTGIEIQPITIPGPDQGLAEAFAAMMSGRADAVVIQGSLSTKRIADLATEHRLPAASTTRAFVDAGGLMSYGADGPALFRHGAKFVQRILQGRQPNDLPIEQPTKFELAINLKTAKAMGLTIPEGFLLRADSLLE